MLMHTMAAQVRRFAGCRRGVPAIEAALIIPIFFLMSLALTEIARYALTVRTVARVAALQAQQVSRFVSQITEADSEIMAQTARVAFPDLPDDYKSQFRSTVAQVTFSPIDPRRLSPSGFCIKSVKRCQVKAVVDWTIQWNSAGWVRPCGAVKLTKDEARGELWSLPETAGAMNMKNVGAVIVVDVSFQYKPISTLGLVGLTIQRQAISVPRYLGSVAFDTALDGATQQGTTYRRCPA